jgi:5-methyltetrahydrofolate--homocysteine methyltransferase
MEQLREMVKTGKVDDTAERVQALLDQGASPEALLKQAMIPAMEEVGDLFQQGEFFLPEMLVAAKAMQNGLAVLRPALAKTGVRSSGTVVIGTVKGDLHDIGKKVLLIALEGAGLDVVDVGTDVSSKCFIEAINEHQPQVVGLSAMLTTTMFAMRDTIQAIEAAGLRDRVKIMIGGAPIQQDFADQIGADYYGPDATSCMKYARSTLAASTRHELSNSPGGHEEER